MELPLTHTRLVPCRIGNGLGRFCAPTVRFQPTRPGLTSLVLSRERSCSGFTSHYLHEGHDLSFINGRNPYLRQRADLTGIWVDRGVVGGVVYALRQKITIHVLLHVCSSKWKKLLSGKNHLMVNISFLITIKTKKNIKG